MCPALYSRSPVRVGEDHRLDPLLHLKGQERVLCLGLLDPQAEGVEDVGEGLEGGLRRLLILQGVEVVHAVSAHEEQRDTRVRS